MHGGARAWCDGWYMWTTNALPWRGGTEEACRRCGQRRSRATGTEQGGGVYRRSHRHRSLTPRRHGRCHLASLTLTTLRAGLGDLGLASSISVEDAWTPSDDSSCGWHAHELFPRCLLATIAAFRARQVVERNQFEGNLLSTATLLRGVEPFPEGLGDASLHLVVQLGGPTEGEVALVVTCLQKRAHETMIRSHERTRMRKGSPQQ